MNRDEVLDIVESARKKGETPDLQGADLQGVDLRVVDLEDADLRGADMTDSYLKRASLVSTNLIDTDLTGAILADADLSFSNLVDAKMTESYLVDADLSHADLQGANLRDADLCSTDLSYANLRGADLTNTNLDDSNLSKTVWYGLRIDGLSSHQLTFTPTPEGWTLKVGCWEGTPEELHELIAQDEGWTKAVSEEITRCRPYLENALALCEIHMKDHADHIEELKKKWADK